MTKGRMEAFSDGVIAIIITIMVLEIRPPHGAALADLRPLLPTALAYLLSFVNVGIYWNNHHHLLHATDAVNGMVLWANIHFLFWLSLMPFVTAWMGEHPDAPWPVAIYSAVLLMCGVAYYLLSLALQGIRGHNRKLARAMGSGLKEKLSVLLYTGALGLSFANTKISLGLIGIVACMWLVPDRRVEHAINDNKTFE